MAIPNGNSILELYITFYVIFWIFIKFVGALRSWDRASAMAFSADHFVPDGKTSLSEV